MKIWAHVMCSVAVEVDASDTRMSEEIIQDAFDAICNRVDGLEVWVDNAKVVDVE